MVDDNRSGPHSPSMTSGDARPRYQKIDYVSSRKRAAEAVLHRRPTDVDDIKSRLKAALKKKIVESRKVAPQMATPAPAPQDTPPVKVSPLPAEPQLADSAPAIISSQPEKIEAKAPMADQKSKDDAPAEPIMSENGFQIFKPHKPEQESSSFDPLAASLDDADDHINKTVDPVPMGADAIEEALKLIDAQAEDHDDNARADDQDQGIGFIPASINPGTFGAAPSTEPTSSEDSSLSAQDDEDIINALLNEDGPVLSSMPEEKQDDTSTPNMADEGDKSPALHLVENSTSDTSEEHNAIPEKDHLQNWQIGQAIASSIRHIVKDEVDIALDRMAREAVRDALRAHR